MWASVAAVLAKDHRVVVPDLRGMGLSSHPESGYDKKTQARDIAAVMDKLKIEKAAFVTHDIGNMVGYAFAAQFPARVMRWVVIDAPLPGIGPWDEIIRSPALWHFNFRDRTWSGWSRAASAFTSTGFGTNFPPDPKAIKEATRRHYARLYARPGAMHSAFNQFAAFTRDAADNKAFAANGKLTMPVLALGGEHSFGTQMADIMRLVATDVTGGVIAKSGHWVMEEQPKQTTAAIVDFIEKLCPVLVHHDLRAHMHAAIQIDDVVVDESETAECHGSPDCLRRIRAIDPRCIIIEAQHAGAQRVAGTAGQHTGLRKLLFHHLQRCLPLRPLGHTCDAPQASKVNALASNADPVAQSDVFRLNEIEKMLQFIDDDSAHWQ
jgi:pimeloyl-ACP methyl ester carboxylesterase